MGNVDDEVFECLMAGYDLSAMTYKIISIVKDKEVTDDVKWKRNT